MPAATVEYFQDILSKYWQVCNSSESMGICNGHGMCDFKQRKCMCDADIAYQDEDNGMCYPKCEGGCGHGKCVKGSCQCDFNEEHKVGFYTPLGQPACSKPCGSKVFATAGTDDVLLIPGTDKVLGAEPISVDCFCRQAIPGYDVRGQGMPTTPCQNPTTYSCHEQDRVICDSPCVFSGCPVYTEITCTHGSGVECPHADIQKVGGAARGMKASLPMAEAGNRTGQALPPRLVV
ncbi:unnamed protein product [Symbiodinium pilosum]|uniref:EGF-like domain-containing protein n=1 Tax=Symbiodinium pilosum TaxID=2952 RepID=A0A812YF23_SYMPI|nr:unnamed protein product [Symbiodinium pilosum]